MAIPLTPEQVAAAYFSGQPPAAPAPAPPPDPQTYYANQQLGIQAFGAPTPPAPPPATPPNPVADLGPLGDWNLLGRRAQQAQRGDSYFMLPTAQAPATAKEQPPAGPPAPEPAPPTRTIAPVEITPSRPVTPGGGGGGSRVDPMSGVKKAQEALYGTYRDQEEALRARGQAEADKAGLLGDAAAEHQRRLDDNMAAERERDAIFEKKMKEDDDYIRHRQDAIRAKKIDPTGGVHPVALGFTAAVSMALQGLVSIGTKGRTNIGTPFMDLLNRHIDRAVAAQENELNTEKGILDSDINMLGQHRAQLRDNRSADHALRMDYLAAAKKTTEDQAIQAGESPIAKARAAEAIGQVDEEMKKLQLAYEEARAKANMAAASAQASNLAAQRTQRMAMHNHFLSQAIAGGKSPEDAAVYAENETNRGMSLLYGVDPKYAGQREGAPARQGGDPLSGVPRDLRNEAAKELNARDQAEKGIAALRAAFEESKKLGPTAGPWDRDRAAINANILGAYKQALGPGMSSDRDAETFLEPLAPKYGQSDEAKDRNFERIARTIRGKVATPILNQYSQQQQQTPQQKQLDLKPVK